MQYDHHFDNQGFLLLPSYHLQKKPDREQAVKDRKPRSELLPTGVSHEVTLAGITSEDTLPRNLEFVKCRSVFFAIMQPQVFFIVNFLLLSRWILNGILDTFLIDPRSKLLPTGDLH